AQESTYLGSCLESVEGRQVLKEFAMLMYECDGCGSRAEPGGREPGRGGEGTGRLRLPDGWRRDGERALCRVCVHVCSAKSAAMFGSVDRGSRHGHRGW